MNWSVWKYLPWLRTSFARGNPLLCRPSIWVHGAMCILRAFKARLIIALGNFKYRGQWALILLSRYFGDLGNQTGFCLLSHTKYRLDLAKEQIELNIFMMKVLHTGATVQSMFKNSGLIWWNLAKARIWICRSKEQNQWNIWIFARKITSDLVFFYHENSNIRNISFKIHINVASVDNGYWLIKIELMDRI